MQSNFGGVLRFLGVPVGQNQAVIILKDTLEPNNTSRSLNNRADGSIMMLVATDAPLSDRNLTRLAWRAMGA